MAADARFAPHVLEPLEISGVESFTGGQLVVRARIKTVPLKQWDVGRELRKRIARLFQERGIDIPFPQMMVHVEGLPDLLRVMGRPAQPPPTPASKAP